MWPTILCAAVVALILAAIVIHGIRSRRRHKGGCGCGCDACPGHDLCHPAKQQEK